MTDNNDKREELANASRWAAGFNAVFSMIVFFSTLFLIVRGIKIWTLILGIVIMIISMGLWSLAMQEFRRASLQDQILKMMGVKDEKN